MSGTNGTNNSNGTPPAKPKAGDLAAAAQGLKAKSAALAAATKKAGEPNYGGGDRTPGALFGGQPPHVTTGPLGEKGYSLHKAASYCLGVIAPDQCKEEIEVHNQLKRLYAEYRPFYAGRSFLVPVSTRFIHTNFPDGTPNGDAVKLVGVLRQKMAAAVAGFDPEEAAWVNRKVGGKLDKAIGTLSDTTGGVLVGFPTLGEVIDLQRNLEVFPQLDATEVALPPNGRMMFPKLTAGATAYWVGEGATLTDSNETTGSLLLEGKKLAVKVPINNESLRYAGPATEGLVRTDMARVGALAADKGMLDGTGGTQIKGIINYPTTTSWAVGTDKLILHTAKTAGTNGDTFGVEDVALMEGKLPDGVTAPTGWIFRKDWFGYVQNRRADAVTAGDGAGPFVFSITRGGPDGRWTYLYDTKVVRSRQVANNRVKGSGTTLTYGLLGYWPDWIVARFGVAEFMANPYSDTAFNNDQTYLRMIQILDAGARHPASMVMVDNLLFA